MSLLKTARRHRKEGENHLQQKSNTQRNGRHWWRATSCSGWTKPRWKMKQKSNTQIKMEGIDGGLRPAVDGQSPGERWNRKATHREKWKALMEGYVLQWMDKAQVKDETEKQHTEKNGRHWWRATSCSGWTKPRWKMKQKSNTQREMEGIDGGLRPAVDGQSPGEIWNRKATDRGQWKALMEGYILQWMDKAQVKDETGKQHTERNGRHWWRATSCSGWTKPRWNMKQESNRQRTMEGIDGGLHPAVDGQSPGEKWKVKTSSQAKAGIKMEKWQKRDQLNLKDKLMVVIIKEAMYRTELKKLTRIISVCKG